MDPRLLHIPVLAIVFGGLAARAVAQDASSVLTAPEASDYERTSTDQGLGRPVFALLEPRSDDGFVAWGFFDQPAGAAAYYPIVRIPAKSTD